MSKIPIVREPGRCGGNPTVGPTRIAVHDIVGSFLMYEGDVDLLLEETPHRTQEEVKAALDYYRDNQAEIDEILRARRESYEAGLARQQAAARPKRPGRGEES